MPKASETPITAAAPLFAPVRLTNFQKDDRIMMSGVRISDDGAPRVHARRRTKPRRLVAQPSATPTAGTRGPGLRGRPAAARGAWSTPLIPNWRRCSAVLFVKGGSSFARKSRTVKPVKRGHRARRRHPPSGACRAIRSGRPTAADRIRQHPHRSQLRRRVRRRDPIGEVNMSPSVDFDTTPIWLADSKHLMFTGGRGLPFGLQRNKARADSSAKRTALQTAHDAHDGGAWRARRWAGYSDRPAPAATGGRHSAAVSAQRSSNNLRA